MTNSNKIYQIILSAFRNKTLYHPSLIEDVAVVAVAVVVVVVAVVVVALEFDVQQIICHLPLLRRSDVTVSQRNAD